MCFKRSKPTRCLLVDNKDSPRTELARHFTRNPCPRQRRLHLLPSLAPTAQRSLR